MLKGDGGNSIELFIERYENIDAEDEFGRNWLIAFINYEFNDIEISCKGTFKFYNFDSSYSNFSIKLEGNERGAISIKTELSSRAIISDVVFEFASNLPNVTLFKSDLKRLIKKFPVLE